MSRTGAHVIIILCLMGAVYYTGKSHGIEETGNYCAEVLDDISDRLKEIIGVDNG